MIKSVLHALNALLLIAITGGLAAWQLGEWDLELGKPNGQLEGLKTRNLDSNPNQSSGRIFVLFIESLRNETARSQDHMPYLSALTGRSLYGTLTTVYDAATEPALIAAFTGQKQNKALGALRVYINPSGHIESLFTSATKNNLKSVIYSDYLTFSIFRRDFTERRLRSPKENTSPVDPSYTYLPLALQEFLTRDIPLVIYHIDELEAVAHKRGVEHQEYFEVTQTIDQMIREIDQQISSEDYLLVFGDHGHTLQGRHSLGLDVPTFFLLRGPGVTTQELPESPINVIHYLITSILKIPPSQNYEGPLFNIFAPLDPHGFSSNEISALGKREHSPTHFWPWIAVSVAIGICGVFWHQGNLLISLILRPKIAGFSRVSFPTPLNWLAFQVIGGAIAGVFFFFIGQLLCHFSSYLKDPPLHIINKFWLAALFVFLFRIPRRSPASLGLLIFLLPFFFLMPNFYRYGAPGVFAPAWILWVIGMGKLAYHQNRVKHRPFSLQVIYMIGVLIYILQLFFFAEGQKQTTSWFTPLISEITPTSVFIRSLIGAASAFYLTYRSHSALPSKILSWLFAIYVLLIQMHIVPHGGPAELIAAGILLVSALIWKPLKAGRYFQEPFHFPKTVYVMALILLSFEVLRLNLDARVNFLLLLSAIRLSLMLMQKILDPYRSKENHILFITLVGFVGVGWLTLGWGFSRLDWAPIFDYVPPELVGRKMGHFLPIILVRFALPIVLLRTLIEEFCNQQHPFPSGHLGLVLGTKYLSLLLIILGIGFAQPGSLLYFEAVAQLGVFLILGFGFL